MLECKNLPSLCGRCNLWDVSASVAGLPGCQALCFAVPQDSFVGGEMKKSLGEASSAEAMVTTQGCHASPTTHLGSSWWLISKSSWCLSASSCGFLTHPHSFLLIYAILHFSLFLKWVRSLPPLAKLLHRGRSSAQPAVCPCLGSPSPGQSHSPKGLLPEPAMRGCLEYTEPLWCLHSTNRRWFLACFMNCFI